MHPSRSYAIPPPGYTTPHFPSIYWPAHADPRASSLYYTHDVWRFTMIWTLIIYESFHLVAAVYAWALQWRHSKVMWIVPVVYGITAGIEAVLAGSIVGLLLGAIYTAGNFRMSTWIPLIWGCINVLVLILSSFSIQGGL